MRALPWLLPTGAVLAVLAFAIVSSSSGSAPADPAGFDGTNVLASDISALSDDERVDRLFNRVMAAAEAGKTDSVAFFAPMAINSFQALAPLNAHRRFDLGLIHLAAGDPVSARAEADTILVAAPKHLLGLILAMRAASARKDEVARKRYEEQFRASAASEQARKLPEYTDHATEIEATLATLDGRAKPVAVTTPVAGTR